MKNCHVFCFLVYVLLLPIFDGGIMMMVRAEGTDDGLEIWDYVQVRPKAHMFWLLYKSPYMTEDSNRPWPIILWLQGGPGASGVGIGNFQEIGPLDTHLNNRTSTWLKKAHLLFVDSPVGTGYSYVEDEKLLVKNDIEAADDLTTLLIEVFNTSVSLQKCPLFIVAESYGGKHAVTLGLSALKAINEGKLNLILGGVVLGNTWISPLDYVLSWGPLLKDVSRLDNNGLNSSNRLANQIKQQLEAEEFVNAVESWIELESDILTNSNEVNLYNFMLDLWTDPFSSSDSSRKNSMKRYASYLNTLSSAPGNNTNEISNLMNGEIRNKLKIIPKHVIWEDKSDPVFLASEGDFMRPRIDEVGQLLSLGVNVTIYNGQLDVICATKGTEAWVEKLQWDGLKTFMDMKRTAIYFGQNNITKGFYKSYKNLHFYWILKAGHFVPVEQSGLALKMIANITQSHCS